MGEIWSTERSRHAKQRPWNIREDRQTELEAVTFSKWSEIYEGNFQLGGPCPPLYLSQVRWDGDEVGGGGFQVSAKQGYFGSIP